MSAPSFQPIETIAGDVASGFLLLCDHASNALPPQFGSLGLPQPQLERHIGYDIGAAWVTRALAQRFKAPAILTCYSRLLIDPNRGEDDPTLVMRLSDGALIPGNARIGQEEIEARKAVYYQPYHRAISQTLDRMLSAGLVPIVFSVHSFTPAWRGKPRPWHVTMLWDKDPRVAHGMIEHFRSDPTLVVGDNEPYDGCLEGDTLYKHATRRGLPHGLIELRQDLIATQSQALAWAERVGDGLATLIADPAVRTIRHFGSRADS